MRICAGLVGPKSVNVEKALVLKAFLRGSRKPRVIWRLLQSDEPSSFDVEKVMILIENALCRSAELCSPLKRRAHFHKKYEKR